MQRSPLTRAALATGLLQAMLFASANAGAQGLDPAPPLPPPAPPSAAAPPGASTPPARTADADEEDDSRAGRRRARRREEAYVIESDDGGPIPAGYHEETRARRGMVIGGAILFGVSYLFSSLAAAISDDDRNGHLDALYVPVIGPFIQIGSVDSATGRYACVIDGLAQAGGALMFVYGLASPRTVLVRDGFGLQTLVPRPYLTAHGAGFGLGGQF